MDRRSEGSQMEKNRRLTRMKQPIQSRHVGRVIRIEVLPDDVLLQVFDFCTWCSWDEGKMRVEEWQSLVHVCRRWRGLVLGSPCRLKLQLYCTPKTPARNTLDVWPALPLIIRGKMASSSNADNVIAALWESDRVRKVYLRNLAGWQLEPILAAMQGSFPELTYLILFSNHGETQPAIPDSFLGGSAPRLRGFSLYGIPFPGLPNLHLSATHLVSITLENIPHSGYISPEAIVALISVLSSLETLSLGFQSPQSRPDRETRHPPPKRAIIPILNFLHFKGVVEYLEDLVTRIDTPRLSAMYITLFNQIDFDAPRLAQFISRTPIATLSTRDKARVLFKDYSACVILSSGSNFFQIAVSCREPDWQLSSIEQVCISSLLPLSTVENLYIEREYSRLVWKDDAIEDTQWLQLLLPFITVKNLYLSKDFSPGIAAALKGLVGDRIAEVLPSLQNIFVKGLDPSGPFQKNIGQFVAARQLSDQTITISDWVKD